MNNKRKILIAMTAGAILGVLFAPYKGSKTRRKIRKQCKRISEELNGLGKCKNENESQP